MELRQDPDPEFSYISAAFDLLIFLYPETSSLDQKLQDDLSNYKELKTQATSFKLFQSRLFDPEDYYDPLNLLVRLNISDFEFLEFEELPMPFVHHKKNVVLHLNCFRSEVFEVFKRILWCFENLVSIIYQNSHGVFENAEKFRQKWKYPVESSYEISGFAEFLCFAIDKKSQPLLLIFQF